MFLLLEVSPLVFRTRARCDTNRRLPCHACKLGKRQPMLLDQRTVQFDRQAHWVAPGHALSVSLHGVGCRWQPLAQVYYRHLADRADFAVCPLPARQRRSSSACFVALAERRQPLRECFAGARLQPVDHQVAPPGRRAQTRSGMHQDRLIAARPRRRRRWQSCRAAAEDDLLFRVSAAAMSRLRTSDHSASWANACGQTPSASCAACGCPLAR
jgi:hypothetical protein